MAENMEADPFNIALRKYLKQVGVTSQRAIEAAAEQARSAGKSKLTLRTVVTAEGSDLRHVVEGEIDLR